MAYVPPHKRHFKDADRPTPVPDSLVPQFRKNVNLRSPSTFQRGKDRSSFQGPKIVYASSCISRWWPVGSTDNDPIPESFHLECIPCEPVERERGEKPLVLVDRKLPTEANKVMESSESSPWLFIAEKVQPDLLATLQNVKIELESQGEEFKPSFVARFGKIFFHGGSSMSLDIIRNAAIAEANSRNKLNKSFYTHVPSVYLEEIEDLIVPRIGFDFNSEKEQYHVKIFDKSQPDVTISCKCTITEDHGKLEMYKAELNQVRHLVEDISCLYKDLDLRLMLWNKRILMDLDDAEKVAIGKLIEAAVVAPDAKGGLRWPLGKESAGDRFSVIGVWHTKYRAFKNPSMKLKLRHADRFDFRSSKGEVSNEATLKMTTISRWLRDGVVDTGRVIKMFQEAVKLIWDNFLDCNHKLA